MSCTGKNIVECIDKHNLQARILLINFLHISFVCAMLLECC
jgi:hypothetical protein